MKQPKQLAEMQPGCASCRHWKEQTETGDPKQWGTCHRYPPTVHYSDDDGAFSMWPILESDERCGEYGGVN